jgi:hypothetical protein
MLRHATGYALANRLVLQDHAMSRLVTILLPLFIAVTIARAQPAIPPGCASVTAPDTPRGRGGASFQEMGDQWWTNPFNPRTPVSGGPRPAPLYQIDSNGLKLALLPAPSSGQSYIRSQCRCTNMKYVGALLNSSQTSRHRFGYVEMQVAVDRLPGFTFQADEDAQPFPLVWPPEIDFPLIYTDASGVQWMKIQVNERGGKAQS